MRLFLRLPPSSVVVCMQKNPNRDGLVRTVSGHRRGGGGTHSLGGADPWAGQAWKCRHRHVLVCARTRCCLHGMQKNPSREGLVRTVSGHGRRVRTCWKGQTTGTGQAVEDTQLGQRKRAQMWWFGPRVEVRTQHVTTRDQRTTCSIFRCPCPDLSVTCPSRVRLHQAHVWALLLCVSIHC